GRLARGSGKRTQGAVGALSTAHQLAGAEAARTSVRRPCAVSTAGSNLRDDLVEEVAAGTILHLYDPDVRIEAQFACESLFHLGFGRRLLGQACCEQPIRRARDIKDALRRRAEKLSRAVQSIDL